MALPVPILIVGPSGVGKSTIIERIALMFPQVERFKTTTTREPRHASDNRYHFVSRDEFKQMVSRDEFLEWTETHGNLYGTERRVLSAILDQGKYPLPSNAIDIKGVEAYKKAFPNLLAIFIAYDSLEKLPERIRKTRPETSEVEIERRLTTAQEEMAATKHFDHIVHNHEGLFDQAVAEVATIITDSLDLKPTH
jgi:guanylate kinase